MRALVDTNIWLDIVMGRKPFCDLSKAAILACINDEVEIQVAATSLKDIFYLVARHQDVAKAYESIEMILSIAFVAPVDGIVCTRALELERPDYEDGIIAAVATAEHADCIISRDAKAFRKADAPRYSPEEFLHAQGYAEITF